MSHLSSRVEPHWWSLTCRTSCIELQPVACFWGMGPALNCDQDMFRRQLRYSGGTSNLGVDAGLRGRHSSSLHADSFEGWCSPRTASGSCCGDGGSSLVRVSGLRGAYRPSNAHEDGRPVTLKTDLDCTKYGPAS